MLPHSFYSLTDDADRPTMEFLYGQRLHLTTTCCSWGSVTCVTSNWIRKWKAKLGQCDYTARNRL